MTDDTAAPDWAPRVPQQKVRRLYLSDARGLLDEDLLDEVAYGFFARCQSILTVTEAEHGTVRCPRCGQAIPHSGPKEEELRCPGCSWHTTWGAYLKSYQHKQLSGGSAVGAFAEYVRRLPEASSPKEKMLLVDWLLHEVHKTALSGEEMCFWRPAAVNLIQGNMTQVILFLEELAAGPQSTPELRRALEDWLERTWPRLWGVEARLAGDEQETGSDR
jgi:ribosomal protein L37AE/L43A